SLPPSLPPSLPCSHVLSTQAQVVKYHLPVFMDRSNAIEGQGINLTVGAAPTSFFICNWYRGSDSQEKLIVTVYLPPLSGYVFGPAYTRRETPGPNCSLQIENLNQDDSGTYTVTKDGPSVHGRGNLSVEVLGINFPFPSPSGLLPKPNMSLVQLFRENMDLVHLKCDTTVKFANISWLQNGKPLRSCSRIQLSNNKQTLTIQPVLRRDAGAYQCHISNLFSARRSDTTIISVIYGPDPPVIKMSAMFLTQPSNGRLNCKASSFPEAEYCWFHNGKEFSKIVCKNNKGRIQINKYIHIHFKKLLVITLFLLSADFLPKPNVTAKPSNAIEELHPVHFFCNAPNDLMITWFKDRELYTNESHLLDNNKTLLIPSVTKNDTGGYQCQITNHTSTRISDIFNFNVVYGPDTPAIEPTQRYYNEHTKVLLTCKADSFPQPRYVWFHNGKKIDTGPKLFLEDFVEDKTGSYICQAGNDLLQKKRNSSSLEIYLEKSE
uniref:Ig-like domain-containing protein n=1 Tax=Pseudonaja textilis TaxID=8673 RepID=A0A670ZXP4_PSETE